MRGFGPDNQTVIIFESLMDSRSLFLTANTESIYAMAWLESQERSRRRRESAEHARTGGRLLVSLRHRPWDRRARQGQGRQVPVPAAGLHRHAARGLLHLQVANIRQHLRDARLSGERRSEAGRGRHQAAAADLSAGGRRESTGDELHQRVRARPSTRSMRWMPRSSRK